MVHEEKKKKVKIGWLQGIKLSVSFWVQLPFISMAYPRWIFQQELGFSVVSGVWQGDVRACSTLGVGMAYIPD